MKLNTMDIKVLQKSNTFSSLSSGGQKIGSWFDRRARKISMKCSKSISVLGKQIHTIILACERYGGTYSNKRCRRGFFFLFGNGSILLFVLPMCHFGVIYFRIHFKRHVLAEAESDVISYVDRSILASSYFFCT